VVVDPSGKLNGRGAYLCNRDRCWEQAIGGQVLARALKTEIDDNTRDGLRGYRDERRPAGPTEGNTTHGND